MNNPSGYTLFNSKNQHGERFMQEDPVSPYVLFAEHRTSKNTLFEKTLSDHDRTQCKVRYPEGLHLTREQEKYVQDQTYFIVFAWTNHDEKLVHFIHELLHVIQYIGRDKVFISVYESHSSDKAPHLLQLFKDMLVLLEIDHFVHSPFRSPLDEEENTAIDIPSDMPFKPRPKIPFRPRRKHNRPILAKPKLRRKEVPKQQIEDPAPLQPPTDPVDILDPSDNHSKCAKYKEMVELMAQFTKELGLVKKPSNTLDSLTKKLKAMLEHVGEDCLHPTSDNPIVPITVNPSNAASQPLQNIANQPIKPAQEVDPEQYYIDRISFLADVRNKSIEPLHFLSNKFTKIIYLNDVFFCWEDIIRLILLRDADMACSLDFDRNRYGIKVYDMWVTRDMQGKMLKHTYPYFSSEYDGAHLRDNKPFQVLNCWNGLVVMNAEPFYKDVEFRTMREDVADCAASECTHICNDFWANGYYKIAVDPLVSVAYDADVYRDFEPYWKAMSNENSVIRSHVDWDRPIPWVNSPPPSYECCPLEIGNIHTEGECHDISMEWIKDALHKREVPMNGGTS